MLFAGIVRHPAARVGFLHQPPGQFKHLGRERVLVAKLRFPFRIGMGQRLRGRRVHLVDPLRALRLLFRGERFLPALPGATLQLFPEDFFVVGVRPLPLQARPDPIGEAVAVGLHLFRLGFALRCALVPRVVFALRSTLFAGHRLPERLDESAHRARILPALRLFLFARHVPRDVRRHREQVTRRLDHDPPVRLAEPFQIQAVAPVPRIRFPLLGQLQQFLHRHLRHLHPTRCRAVADHPRLPPRKSGPGFRGPRLFHRDRIHKLQPPPREIAPGIARQREFHGLREPFEPDASRHAVARAIVNFAADDGFINAPGHRFFMRANLPGSDAGATPNPARVRRGAHPRFVEIGSNPRAEKQDAPCAGVLEPQLRPAVLAGVACDRSRAQRRSWRRRLPSAGDRCRNQPAHRARRLVHGSLSLSCQRHPRWAGRSAGGGAQVVARPVESRGAHGPPRGNGVRQETATPRPPGPIPPRARPKTFSAGPPCPRRGCVHAWPAVP